jgi:hypothetical protein
MTNKMGNRKFQAGFGLIEIVLSLAIILCLYYVMSKEYLGKPQIDKKTQKILSEHGIETGNYNSILDTVKKKLKAGQSNEHDKGGGYV